MASDLTLYKHALQLSIKGFHHLALSQLILSFTNSTLLINPRLSTKLLFQTILLTKINCSELKLMLNEVSFITGLIFGEVIKVLDQIINEKLTYENNFDMEQLIYELVECEDKKILALENQIKNNFINKLSKAEFKKKKSEEFKVLLETNTCLKNNKGVLPIKLTPRLTDRSKTIFYNQLIETQSKENNLAIKAKVSYGGPELGNQVLSTIPLTSNETVLIDTNPIVFTITSHFKRNHCSFCLNKVTRQRLSCPNQCIGITYCSLECQLKDFEQEGHKVLCDQKLLNRKGYEGYGLDAWSEMAIKFFGKVITQFRYNNSTLNPISLLGLSYLCCSSDNWSLEEEERFSLNNFIPSLKQFLLFQSILSLEKSTSLSIQFDFDFFIKFRLISQANTMNLNSSSVSELGSGLFPLASMVNHSCQSNAQFIINSNKYAEVRIRDNTSHVKQGDPLTISYFPVRHMGYEMRQEYFKTTYQFQCKCTRCLKDEAKIQNGEIDEQLEDSTISFPKYFDLSSLFD